MDLQLIAIKIFRVLFIFVLLLPISIYAKGIEIGDKQVLESKILGEEREYFISLPTSYNQNNYSSYPVLYLLDGDMNSFFQVFSGMVNQMSVDASPTIPEMIVVGIVSQNRVRDSSPTHSLIQYGGTKNEALHITGGADKFIQFIKEELIPRINQNYRTSAYKVLVGYSFAGLPVIQSLYTTPETFNAYLAIDPSMWWDDQHMLKQLSHFYQSPKLNKRRLFVATTTRVTEVYPKENYVAEFIERLKTQPKEGLFFDSITFGRDENHHTMPIISFYKGLRSLFDGYMIDDHARFRPANVLRSHFAQFSQKLGEEFRPKEDLVNFFAYDRLYNTQFSVDIESAIDFFKLNAEYYPLSPNVWDSLGEAYMVNGDYQQALTCYEKSIALNSSNANALSRIEQIKSKLN